MISRSLIFILSFSLILLAAVQGEAAVVSPGIRIMQSRRSDIPEALVPKDGASTSSPDCDSGQNDEEESYIPVIIKLSKPSATLPDAVVELYRRGDLLLAYIPAAQLDQLADTGYFSRIEGRQAGQPSLDRARSFTGYNLVADAEGLPRQFTGRNVVVGFTDSGFDPNHIEFIAPQTDQSRVKLLTHYTDIPQEIVRLSSTSDISSWATDSPDMYHATHVAAILAGGYKGNDYYGIAPEAEIVASTSMLYDPLLLAGMEDVIAYAKENGMPAVINMSVSCGIGPHDGTSLFSQYLERLAEDAVICISSGNDGMRTGLFTNTFVANRPAAFTLLDLGMSSSYTSGSVDIWSNNANPLSFHIIIYDREASNVVYRLPISEITADNPEVYMEFSDEFEEYMEGTVALASEINPENGKFNATFYFDLYNYPQGEDQTPSTRYAVGIEMSGQEGQSVRAYASDNLQMKIRGNYDGHVTTNGCLNDFVTGTGVIGVGALTSRNTWPLTDGNTGNSSYIEGKIADFSGYWGGGGVLLPDIVAPGAHLISALSTPFVENNSENIIPSFSEEINGKQYHWIAACGTSMSSPYVAGVCALMLEANPDLTPAEVKEIILASASTPSIEPGSPRWGRGILNSYAAVKAAVDKASTTGIDIDPESQSSMPIEIFDISGSLVGKYPADTSISSIPLPPGVYIIRQDSVVAKFLR